MALAEHALPSEPPPPLRLLDLPPGPRRSRPAREPRRPSVAEGRVAAEVQARFDRDPELAGVRIRVAVREGVAVLEGCTCATASEAAERIAAAVPGVRRVDNFLRVRDPWRPSDDDLRRMVADALSRDGHDGVAPEVENGVLVLSGAVPGDREREAAERLALDVTATVPGRVPVANRVAIDPVSAVAAGLAAAVEAAFVLEACREAAAIAIRLDGDVAILDGAVPNAAHRALAERAVAAMPGIAAVTNRLRVGR